MGNTVLRFARHALVVPPATPPAFIAAVTRACESVDWTVRDPDVIGQAILDRLDEPGRWLPSHAVTVVIRGRRPLVVPRSFSRVETRVGVLYAGGGWTTALDGRPRLVGVAEHLLTGRRPSYAQLQVLYEVFAATGEYPPAVVEGRHAVELSWRTGGGVRVLVGYGLLRRGGNYAVIDQVVPRYPGMPGVWGTGGVGHFRDLSLRATQWLCITEPP